MRSLGPGQPLPASERAYFEPRFGADFSGVRVHSGARAEAAAESVSARAFALGSDLVFGAGEFQPGSAEGRSLIAHELTHTVQQGAVPQGTRQQGRVPRGAQAQRIQRKCKNRDKAEKLKEAAKAALASGESVEVFELNKEKTYTDVAKKFRADNKVRSSKELADKMVGLNGGKSGLQAGQCVVVIKGWTSPAWLAHQARVDCTMRIAKWVSVNAIAMMFGAPSMLTVNSFARETVIAGDKGYESVVKRAKAKDPSLFQGRPLEYAKNSAMLNDSVLGSTLKEGDCVVLLKGWKDPNMGTMPAKPNASKPLDNATAHVVATVFGEQTQAGTPEDTQREYIFYAMRHRVGSAGFAPNLASVVNAGTFHAIGGTNYKAAKAQLESGSITNPVVQSARDTVLAHWNTPLPADSGPFYFHWRSGSTSAGCYKSSKKDLAAEKRCAHKWAAKQGWNGPIDAATGWLKRIRSSGGTPLLSMYIYPGD